MTNSSSRAANLTATELVAAYRTRDLSPVDVLHDVASVIEAREPQLNAFWQLDLQGAEDAATRSEKRWSKGEPIGPVDGVPLTVKENLARAGVPMPAGNAGLTPVWPERSSPVVERIEESGGVILGSTVMPDWGMLSSGVSSLHGITRSPWNPALTPPGGRARAPGRRPPPATGHCTSAPTSVAPSGCRAPGSGSPLSSRARAGCRSTRPTSGARPAR
jgi:aspartyl-tRNA(Asn)/glutamyl-tRNA(Gln) amidotransferase subunit A